jgi:hypothetical protein
MTISKDENVIYSRAIGYSSITDAGKQPSTTRKVDFQLNEKGEYSNTNQAGEKMEFNTDKNEMTLKQNGGVFLFKKDK